MHKVFLEHFFTKSRLANSFLRFQLTTRTAATRCKSTRATLSPRIIRGDKVLLTDNQLVTAVRVHEKLTFNTYSKPLPGNENDLMGASLKNLYQRLSPAGHMPGTFLILKQYFQTSNLWYRLLRNRWRCSAARAKLLPGRVPFLSEYYT